MVGSIQDGLSHDPSTLLTKAVLDNLSFLGSILIFCVGANLAFDTKLRVANMLPALVFGGLWTTFI